MSDTDFTKSTRNNEMNQAIVDWWEGLLKEKGNRAMLRRCGSLTNVMFVPAYHKLRLTLMRFDRKNDIALACVAGLLAHVSSNIADQPTGKLMVKPKEKGGNPRVSELRFRRLIQCKDHEDLFGSMIRIIRLIDGAVAVTDLARDVYWWGDQTRKQWAFDYYSNL